VTCDRCCGELAVGAWPFCKGRIQDHAKAPRGRSADVTWPGGKTFENLGPEPVTLYSPAELTREMRERGLEPFVRHVDGDKHVERWVSVDLTDYYDPAVQAQRRQAMADWLGMSLEEYHAITTPKRAGGVVVYEPEPEQAPVVDRYIRGTDETFTVKVGR
jgi:hypothetical protein